MLAQRLNVQRDKVFDVPQYMIDDEMMIMAAEAASDTTKPTQDLMAKDRDDSR